jgi:2-polyprenyl-3-methyl-5-hydroxy-6-metoxy-1,4-benzoquinol methylase
VSSACAVCGCTRLRLHLRVEQDGNDLVATTTRYGSAPADIVRCSDCGHMQVAELPAAGELDESYAEVSDAAYVDEEPGQRATAAQALARIERHVRRGALCDVGCWVGFLLSEAERRGWETWGLEPSRFAAEFARERLGLAVQTGTLETAELPHGRFEAVVLADVIEHLSDPGATIERVAELLAPRGVVYLALPDAGSPVATALGARWWSVIPTHVHYFTRDSLVRLLAEHGFAIEWIGTAPKTFTVRYYLGRLAGYSERLAASAIAAAARAGVDDRLVGPDLRDRMAVVARLRSP